jgi:glycosyltransferase involved in cell wall biosynthesis
LLRETDIVHAHGLKAGWVAALTPGRAPLVVTVHNLVLDEAAGRSAPLLRLLEGALPGRADALIAVSVGIAERFGDAGARMIPPAGPPPVPSRDRATVRAAHGIPAGAPLVVAVARLHPQKDLITLIDSAVLLRALVPDVRVLIVGEGPLEGALRAHIERRGVSDAVTLAGPSANAADEIAAADVVAITSIWESGPLVAAEALELARPVVSTPVGFVPELIEDGRTGRLVPTGDPVALASALADVLGDPVTAAVMGSAGRERARELLGARALVVAVAAVYDEVLARDGRSR